MQVIFHAGVHCTDDDKLLRCLLRNAGDWRDLGVAVPGPGKYRETLSVLANNLGGHNPGQDAREVVLDSILDTNPEQVDRLILSHENFFSVPKILFGGGRLYRKAESRLQLLCDLMKDDDIHLFVGVRNPATFLPAIYGTTPFQNFEELMNGVNPADVRWSDLIRRLRAEVPQVPITVWCNEDTPFIWGDILRRMAGLNPSHKISGAFDLFSSIMNPEGMQRFRLFLKEHPNINEAQKRRVMQAFLDKYALEEEIEQELDLPGWDEAYVDMLCDLYERDMDQIDRIPGVTFIAP
jgi:hypothetical protein